MKCGNSSANSRDQRLATRVNLVRLLERFGINTRATQVRFLQDLTWQVLEELDKLYGDRSAALQQTQHARGN